MAGATHHACAKRNQLCLVTDKQALNGANSTLAATIHRKYVEKQEEFPLPLPGTERPRDRGGARKVPR